MNLKNIFIIFTVCLLTQTAYSKTRTEKLHTLLDKVSTHYIVFKRPVPEEIMTQIYDLLKQGVQINTRGALRNTFLHLSVLIEDFELTQTLIEKGAFTYILNEQGLTPLHIVAIYNKKPDIAQLLVDNGALRKKANANNDIPSPLLLALEKEKFEIANIIFKAGINIIEQQEYQIILNKLIQGKAQQPIIWLMRKLKKSNIPFYTYYNDQIPSPLLFSLMKNRSEISQIIFDLGIDTIEPQEYQMMLNKLIENGHDQSAIWLIRQLKSAKIDLNTIHRDDKDKVIPHPLILAIANKKVNIVQAFFNANVSPNLTHDLNLTPFLVALSYPDLKTIQLIAQHKDFEPYFFEGTKLKPYLHWAISEKLDINIIKAIVDAEVNDIHEDNKYFGYAIHTAIQANYPEAVQVLVDKGVKLTSLNDEGFPPLHQSIIMDLIKIVKILLKAGVSPDSMDAFENTAWTLAKYHERVAILNLFNSQSKQSLWNKWKKTCAIMFTNMKLNTINNKN